MRDPCFILFVDGLFLNGLSRSSLPSPQHTLCTLLSGSIGPNRAPWSQILEHLVGLRMHQAVCAKLSLQNHCIFSTRAPFTAHFGTQVLVLHGKDAASNLSSLISSRVGSVATVDLGRNFHGNGERRTYCRRGSQHLIVSKANMSEFIHCLLRKNTTQTL